MSELCLHFGLIATWVGVPGFLSDCIPDILVVFSGLVFFLFFFFKDDSLLLMFLLYYIIICLSLKCGGIVAVQ